jgi:hypothetical protein
VSDKAQQDRIVLELTGSEAVHGLALSNFAAFIDDFRRALRDFDRQRRAEPTGRGGHPTTREDLVTAFRLVSFKAGSAIVELEPIAPPVEDADQAAIEGAELLPLETLRAFMETIEREEPLDPAVTQSVAGARRALGPDGKIGIAVGNRTGPKRRIVIDEERVELLERRARRFAPRRMRISGRLHMIDVEPDRVAIRAADGIDWVCRYPEAMEMKVKALVDANVWAQGFGQLASASRGNLTLDRLEPAAEFEQTPLFTFERIPLEDLLEEQGIRSPQGALSIVPPDVSDEELDAFLDAVLDD